MTTDLASPPRRVTMRISMPEELFNRIEADAVLAGANAVEEFVVEHVAATIDYTAERPIYLNDADRAAIQKLLGARVKDAASLVGAVSRLLTVAVLHGEDDLAISLSPSQIEQIYWLAKSAGRQPLAMAREVIERAISKELQA